jgi:putative transposase
MAGPKEVPVKSYPRELTNEAWQLLEPLLEEAEPYTTGRPRTHELREIINAIFYLNKTGCQWRYLPKDFPSYKLVSYYYQWVDNNTWAKINRALPRKLRKELGRNEQPSAGIIDSQTVKGTPESAKASGFDGGKLIGGPEMRMIHRAFPPLAKGG